MNPTPQPNQQEIRKAYKVRLYPNKEQEQTMLQTIGACRFVYNYYLNLRIRCYEQTEETIPYASMSRDLTALRNSDYYPWLKDVRTYALQQSLRSLDASYSKFLRKQAGFPHFKSRKGSKQSFVKSTYWTINRNRLHIQSNLRVKCRGTVPPEHAIIKKVTVSYTNTGKWYASIACIETIDVPTAHTGSLGIDLGLTHLAITSDGQKFDNLKLARKRAKRLKYLQQSLARKRKGSNRRAKAKLEVARLYEKVSNQRMNYLHQVSSAITSKNHALIAVEDLSVVNMLKNRSLRKSISDVSWSEFIRQIEYKQRWRGGEFVKVDRFFPSSKTCSNCSKVADSIPLNIRQWICASCGMSHDRDINAAKNILKQAETQLGVESTDGSRKVRVTGSVKRGHAYV